MRQYAGHIIVAAHTPFPLAKGFALTATPHPYSCKVLGFRVSSILTAGFCVAALEDALARYCAPEIFNIDWSSQFTDDDFTALLKAKGVRISVDAKGR